MQHKRRPGKGIKDISHFFLSSTQPPDLNRQWPENWPPTGTPEKHHHVIGVTSHTAGVPEFIWSSLLAFALSRFGKKVVVVDIGTEAKRLTSVLESSDIRPSLDDLLSQTGGAITVEGLGGYRVHGFQLRMGELRRFNPLQREILFEILRRKEEQADILLLNIRFDMTEADLLIYFQSLHEAVFVISPQDLLGSYRILKVLFTLRPDLRVGLVEYGISKDAYQGGAYRLVLASREFLQISPAVLGFVSEGGWMRVEGPGVETMVEIGEKILQGLIEPLGSQIQNSVLVGGLDHPEALSKASHLTEAEVRFFDGHDLRFVKFLRERSQL